MRALILALCAVPSANHLTLVIQILGVKQDTEFLQPRNFSETLHSFKNLLSKAELGFALNFDDWIYISFWCFHF